MTKKTAAMIPSPDATTALDLLDSLELERVTPPGEDVGLVQVSLPVPACAGATLSLNGRPTAAIPLGQWPGAPHETPRRQLLSADAIGRPPEHLAVQRSNQPPALDESFATPGVEMVCFNQSDEPGYVWANHLARITWGSSSLGIAMGLRFQTHVNWWQACNLVVEDRQPFCTTIRMGGAIPVETPTLAEMMSYQSYANPWLHHHNWINGDLYLRLYANGVCEVFARHINSMFVDRGETFEGVVPLVGFFLPKAVDHSTLPRGQWLGMSSDTAGQPVKHAQPPVDGIVNLGDARLDLSEAGRLATPEHPGSWDWHEPHQCLLWQPYEGVELFGGRKPMETHATPWHVRPQQHIFPRGMARTLRFTFSLSDRSPRIARYMPPYAWYGLMAELTPQPLLPVRDELDERLDAATDWTDQVITCGGFEDGAVPRGKAVPCSELPDRYEPGWDGDVPYAQMLLAYRNQSSSSYQAALRSAYHQADVATDHAECLVRMHGYGDNAFALPMHRMLGPLIAWLETGDPYLLDTARGVTDRAFRVHLNSWPRNATGRDACFIRNAVFLYRFTGDQHYLDMAQRASHHVANTQRPNGSFGDQAGGAGFHQYSAAMTKPWMGCLATSPLVDYLAMQSDDQVVRQCVVKFADWLLAQRWKRDGIHGWSYIHDFDGKHEWLNVFNGETIPLPTRGQWHHDQLAAVLGYATLTTGNSAYLQAYYESLTTANMPGGGHGVAATGVYLLWLQTIRAGASWNDSQIEFNPPLPESLRSQQPPEPLPL